MGEWGYRALARRLASGDENPRAIDRLLEFIDGRNDLSDHRLLLVLKLRLSGGDLLPADLRERIDTTLRNFRYSFTEPGDDSMCSWTENHQLLFAVGEYLAGRLLPSDVFSNSGQTGAQKEAAAKQLLMEWLEERFRFGFSEWLSNTYYELDVCALSVLVDHADAELALRATMVLDLLMLDLALHRFEGNFLASAGRAYKRQKTDPRQAEVRPILEAAFGLPPQFNPSELSGIFVARDRYQVPEPILQIARDPGAHRILASHGRLIDEALAQTAERHRGAGREVAADAAVRTAWAMQAMTTDSTVELTLDGMRRHGLRSNDFFSALSRFAGIRSGAVARAALRVLNPVTQGMLLSRANVFTYRTPRYLVSAAQSYLPGEFGDQQHLWQVSLPGGVNVFSTHPGSTGHEGEGRPATPSAWIGNGINPDVGARDNVVLVLHDLRSRSGFLEGQRHLLSHLHFPSVGFDETRLGEKMVVARKQHTFIGVRSLERLEMVSDIELLQRGSVTGWAVLVSDHSEFADLSSFADALRSFDLTWQRGQLRFTGRHALGNQATAADHVYRLHWQRGFTVDGEPQHTNYPRYDCDWVQMPRGALHARIHAGDQALVLDWSAGERTLVSTTLPRVAQ